MGVRRCHWIHENPFMKITYLREESHWHWLKGSNSSNGETRRGKQDFQPATWFARKTSNRTWPNFISLGTPALHWSFAPENDFPHRRMVDVTLLAGGVILLRFECYMRLVTSRFCFLWFQRLQLLFCIMVSTLSLTMHFCVTRGFVHFFCILHNFLSDWKHCVNMSHSKCCRALLAVI